MTLCAWPKAVAGSSHTLIPTLPLPLARVSGGVTTVISRDRVGERGQYGQVEEHWYQPSHHLTFSYSNQKLG